MTSTLTVSFPDRSRQCVLSIGHGTCAGIGGAASSAFSGRRVLLVIDHNVASTHAPAVRQTLESAGFTVSAVEVEVHEKAKTLDTVTRLLDAMLDAGLDRTDGLVAIGGGITTDVAGFAASTYLRGIPWIAIPTTLLAMVDASTGGKTGVNHPLPSGSGIGKNLVGAFWQPEAVLIDPQTLNTLDDRQFRCGLAESIKHGMIDDETLLDSIRSLGPEGLRQDAAACATFIARSVAVKIRVVEEDEREQGRRALLNLGHTFAHAIEPMAELELFHGEAVAIGLIAACALARELGRMTEADESSIRSLIEQCGLPTTMTSPVDAESLLDRMAFDKKTQHSTLRLIVPEGIGSAVIVENPPRTAILAAWAAVIP